MTIQDVFYNYNDTLKNIYPPEEINSMVYLVLQEVSGYSKTAILANKKTKLDPKSTAVISDILERLSFAEPIQQILGKTEFYDLQLKINEHVLIPRPETEELVQLILDKTNNKTKELRIIDIGTGSGCIAIALKKHLPFSSIKAIDIDNNALDLAKINAQTHNLEITFKQMNFLERFNCPKDCAFDIIVSNPPYIMEKEKTLMHNNVLNFEPHKALFVSNSDPLIFYNAISHYASNHLATGGAVFLEINENLGDETCALFQNREYTVVELHKDLHGKNRFIYARKK